MTGATAVTATFGNLSQQLQSVERRLLGQRSLTVLQRLDVTSGRKQRGRQLKFQRGSRPVVGDDVGLVGETVGDDVGLVGDDVGLVGICVQRKKYMFSKLQ